MLVSLGIVVHVQASLYCTADNKVTSVPLFEIVP